VNGERLIEKVLRTIQDPSIESDEVLELLNEGLIEVAGRVLLPALETSGTVDTIIGEYRAELPSNFQHNLFDCQEQDRHNPIRVLNSKHQVLAKYGNFDHTGTVRHVAATRPYLLYSPVPTEVRTLTISFYEKPTPIREKTSPLCLPDQFHKILWRYACYTLFDDIEDGMEGAKVNAVRHERVYEKLISDLQLFYKEGQSRPRPPVSKGEFL